MSLLTADQILEADDLATKDIHVEEWGGTVRIKTMTGQERDEFEAKSVKTKGGKTQQNFENFRARLVAMCVVDEHGKRLFTQEYQVRRLGEKSVAALQRVFNAIQELNGMTDDDVEELTEGFDKAEDGHSTSA